MILPYLLRLLCLCFASFFVLNAAAGLLAGFFSKAAIRYSGSKAPVAAGRLLLALRMLPLVLAGFFVLGLCVPSYLWLEPAATAERVGPVCVFLGILGAITWLSSIVRASHSLFVSSRHERLLRRAALVAPASETSARLMVVEDDCPILAVSGLLRPRLLISRSVLRVLSPDELEAALAHEDAHHAAHDNAKRLLLLVAPDIFPFFRPYRSLESAWSRFAEWAADDRAAAGDSLRALSLAAALVNVARMGASPRLPFLSTSLVACDRDLSARVNRLLHADPAAATNSRISPSLRSTSIFLLMGAALLILAPSTLSFVHELLELLLH